MCDRTSSLSDSNRSGFVPVPLAPSSEVSLLAHMGLSSFLQSEQITHVMFSLEDIPANGGLQSQECSTGWYPIALRTAIHNTEDAAKEKCATV